MGPYFSARRSLKVLTSVQLLQLSFGSFRSGGSLGQALLKLFFPSNFCPYSKALSFCSTEYTFSEHSSTNFLQSARDHAIYQKLPNIWNHDISLPALQHIMEHEKSFVTFYMDTHFSKSLHDFYNWDLKRCRLNWQNRDLEKFKGTQEIKMVFIGTWSLK